jgi:hypothetical protein
MEKEKIDLRDLILKIKEHKQIDTNLALEFDCFIEADDITALVKVINYAINYINQLTDQPLHISLNSTNRDITLSIMAFTTQSDFPEISPKVNEALEPYNAMLEQKFEPNKYAQLLIHFND